MPEAGVRELKIRASEIIKRVREKRVRYLITYRGRPVALLAPLDEGVPARLGGSSAWDELQRLGEEIAKGWRARESSVEILSATRR